MTTGRAPINPSSSPMIAKMKSESALGSQLHFTLEWPRPTPNRRPLPIPYSP